MAERSVCSRGTSKKNEYGYAVLIGDGSKTHITLSNITECKELGVEVVVLPPHLSDVIQPLNGIAFRALKKAFTHLERRRQSECRGRAASPASFVELWTKGFVQTVTPQTILSGFKSCGISPFDPPCFLQYLLSARWKRTEASSPSTLDSLPIPSALHVLSTGPTAPSAEAIAPKVMLWCTAHRKNSMRSTKVIYGTSAWEGL